MLDLFDWIGQIIDSIGDAADGITDVIASVDDLDMDHVDIDLDGAAGISAWDVDGADLDDDAWDDLGGEPSNTNFEGSENLPGWNEDGGESYNSIWDDFGEETLDTDAEGQGDISTWDASEADHDSWDGAESEVDFDEGMPEVARVIEENGYTFSLDENDRVLSAEGFLQVKDHEGRMSIDVSMLEIGQGDELPSDDRGHLIGDQFNGPGAIYNLVPQDAGLNRGKFKQFENELRSYVDEGHKVHLTNSPIYEGASRRPVQFKIDYSIDDEPCTPIFFRNGDAT